MTFLSIQLALDLGKIGVGSGFGPWGFGATGEPGGILTNVISNVIGLMTIIAGIWFIFQLITGAWGFLTAGEDTENVKKAQKKITHSVIGLVVVVAAYALISLFGAILGLDIINLQELISNITP